LRWLSNQYACSTKFGEITPDTITSRAYCSYVSVSSGGGYCGDGYCSALDSLGQPLETTCNCPQDCGTSVLCNPPCTYTYSNWGACQISNTQSRTVLSSTPTVCTGSPILSQPCVFNSECDVASDCGDSVWGDTWKCDGDTSIGQLSSYSCGAHICNGPSDYIDTPYKSCGGGWNAKCVVGTKGCVNQCGTSPANNTDSNCNGCSNVPSDGYNVQCIPAVDPFCNADTECYTNGNTCSCNLTSGDTSGVTINGSCWSRATNYMFGSSCKGNLSNSSAQCRAGFYPIGNSYSSCSPCPAGSSGSGSMPYCTLCGDGSYSLAGATSCTICEAGYYCIKGVKMICPSGTTSPSDSVSVSDCVGDGSGE
jgi:hypothetical protein